MSRWSMKVLASVVTAAALAPKASAFIPEGSVDRVGALYKVRKALFHHETLRLVLLSLLTIILLFTRSHLLHFQTILSVNMTECSHHYAASATDVWSSPAVDHALLYGVY
jgi:hypothetical protein